MRKSKYITPVLLCLSFVSILLVMAALQDIYHNNEPLEGEWLVVRYGMLMILVFHCWIGFNLWKNRKKD